MKKYKLSKDTDKKTLKDLLFKSFQSCNINFLLGAGASYPAIATLGNIENDVVEMQKNGFENRARFHLFRFLKEIFFKSNLLITSPTDENIVETKNNYIKLIELINTILINRKNDITCSTANIFTTNYDLFLEYACENLGLYFHYNDGFRNKNKIFSSAILDVSEFNKTVNYCGQLYGHKTTLPNLNIVKLHGSINWGIGEHIFHLNPLKIEDEFESINISTETKETKETKEIKGKQDFTENEEITQLLSKLGIVNPTKKKFEETVLNQIYYNLLRFFSNELDKENSILFAMGFSFNDEHLKDLVTRVLTTNPTLQLFISVRSEDKVETFEHMFENYNNVSLIFSDEELNFSKFNDLLNEILKGLHENE